MSSERLVDAARAVVTFWLQTGLVDQIRMTTLQAAVANVSALPPASPAPAKGVRCKACNDTGWNTPTGSPPEPDYCPHCPDSAPPVAAPAPASEPEKCPMCGTDGPCECPIELNNAPPVAAPAPAMPRESAEQFAKRAMGLMLDRGDRRRPEDILIPEVSARDATFTAEVDAAKALIAHNVEVIAARDAEIANRHKTIRKLEEALNDANGMLASNRREVTRLGEANERLRARLAEREAGGGEEKELLDVASRVLAGIVAKIPLSVVTDIHNDIPGAEKWSYERGMRVRDGAVAMAVSYARAIHAALSDRGQG